eukprot:TRINITY_DN1196_c0_g1_i1.p1 TRINITY_DN1196_c0_g1~~TRINITY_DN1196_c0_g1_i1.p1  ORF type:complete len:221 (-),score=34.78 TRINITY_DN1196_c0_g1_i1:99-761(-)
MKASVVLLVLTALFAVAFSFKGSEPDPMNVCTSDQWVSQTHELIWTAGDNMFRTYDGTIYYDADSLMLRVDTYAITDDYNVSNIYNYYSGVMYTIYDGECYSSPLDNVTTLENCLPDDATFQNTFYIAGSNAVDSWVVEDEYFYQEFHLAEGSNIILSETTYDTTYGNVTYYDELLFVNWVDGNVDPDVFVIPDICDDAMPYKALDNVYRPTRFFGKKLF